MLLEILELAAFIAAITSSFLCTHKDEILNFISMRKGQLRTENPSRPQVGSS